MCFVCVCVCVEITILVFLSFIALIGIVCRKKQPKIHSKQISILFTNESVDNNYILKTVQRSIVARGHCLLFTYTLFLSMNDKDSVLCTLFYTHNNKTHYWFGRLPNICWSMPSQALQTVVLTLCREFCFFCYRRGSFELLCMGFLVNVDGKIVF